MYLTMRALTGVPDTEDLGWVDDVLTALDGDKAARGAVVTRAEREASGHLALLWDDAGDATRSAGEATGGSADGGVRVEPGRVFAVTVSGLAPAAGAGRFVQLTEFSGPRSAEWVAANERAGRERIWPAVRDLPGTVGVISGVAEDGASLVVSLSESREAIGSAARAIMSTELLPGERPEFLTGPDRIAIERIVHQVLPGDGWGLS